MSAYSTDTANTKWCPHVNAFFKPGKHAPVAIGNRTIADPEDSDKLIVGMKHAGCIADSCMLWRWESKTATMKRQKELDATRTEPDEKAERHGFCGLGAPIK